MTRNTALRLLTLLLMALLFVSLVGDPALGYGAPFVCWGLSTVAIGNLFVALFRSGRGRQHYPSG